MNIKPKHVEFVSYDGKYPNLCSGVLCLWINGDLHYFGNEYKFKPNKYDKYHHPVFWTSGGGLDEDYCSYSGDWIINVDELPEEFRKYAAEIDEVFNENVPHGCCGGCA